MIIIPEHIQIEPVSGYCTSSCAMCTIDKVTRGRNIMSVEMFETILTKFLPYRDRIKYVSLTGMGESLLDKNLARKIKIAKEMDFHGIGFTTNATELSKSKSQALIQAGLNTIICSIDGVKKETHEAIRHGTDFNKVVRNVEAFIRLRNDLNGSTKVIVRFVRQKANKNEWPEFFEYWFEKIDEGRGDEVVKFDVINWADTLHDYDLIDVNENCELKEAEICEEVFKRMWIYSNGEVALCCGDSSGFYKMGNVIDQDPIEIYNNEVFEHYRRLMLEGRLFELKHCGRCTIPRSRELHKIEQAV